MKHSKLKKWSSLFIATAMLMTTFPVTALAAEVNAEEINQSAECQSCDENSHIWDDGEVTDTPTYESTGTITYTCTDCGYVRQEIIPQLTHNFSSVWSRDAYKHWHVCIDSGYRNLKSAEAKHSIKTFITPATLKKNGSVTKKCTVCGYISYDNYIPYIEKVSLTKTKFVYNKTAQKPTAKVTDVDDEKVNSKYYTIKYSDSCKQIGNHTATITFKGRYSGQVIKTFTIVPSKTGITMLTSGAGSFTVQWKKQSVKTSGYQIQFSLKSDFSDAKTRRVTDNTITSRKVKNLVSGKKYYVRIRTYKTVGSEIYNSYWSKTKTIIVK